MHIYFYQINYIFEKKFLLDFQWFLKIVIWIPDEKVMVSRIRGFPVAREFPEPREIPITREFPRLKLFPPVSRETGISREFPARGFPLNITDRRFVKGFAAIAKPMTDLTKKDRDFTWSTEEEAAF